MNAHLHRTFDRMPEPKRFGVLLFLTVPSIIFVELGGWSWVNSLGLVWLVALLVSRAAYVHRAIYSGDPSQ